MDQINTSKCLPLSVYDRSKDLIGLTARDDNPDCLSKVRQFVENFIPNRENIEEEIIMPVRLGVRASRVRPRKGLIRNSISAPNRGTKRLTSAEKRELGLLRLKKKNKTFEMFIPVHKMWKKYAQKVLSTLYFIDHYENGTAEPKVVESLQNKFKKLELFGSIIKVTRSRCSEYVGLEGIVIQETKNTFSIITTDNKVKLIPKLHSEFSLIVGKLSFTIFGNHLHQRPVDKAKQNFKKHSLWL